MGFSSGDPSLTSSMWFKVMCMRLVAIQVMQASFYYASALLMATGPSVQVIESDSLKRFMLSAGYLLR
jgi:hypothetical protein